MKIFMGVDHGLRGALATITEDGEIHGILQMPLKSGEIDCFEIYSWLFENYGDYEHEIIACGEKLNAIFRASASSTFNFGKNIGKVTGIIECLEMEYSEVTATTWQKFFFDLYQIEPIFDTKKTPSGKTRKDTKSMALIVAQKIWGNQIDPYMNKDGIVDALLIAEYARRSSL